MIYLEKLAHPIDPEHLTSEFNYTASEEMRTHSTLILGFSEILVNPVRFDIALEKQKEFPGIIHENAKELERIIDALMN